MDSQNEKQNLPPEENFIFQYTKFNAGTEVPELFAIWCGIAGISAALGRRVWIDMGQYTIFPNLYIVLVAGSGRLRKSTAISVVEELLRCIEPKPNLIAQKITPEGLIDALRTVELSDPAKFMAERCEGFIIADELATLINKASYEAGLASLLIPFFDCKRSFEYRTKGGGAQKITNSCLGILGASTVDWITNAFPESAIGGGLTSRIIFVYVQTPPPPVAITSYGTDKLLLKEKLISRLQDITMLSGPVTLTQEAWDYYVEVYNDWQAAGGKDFVDNKYLSGYFSRRNMHWLKLGIIFSVAEGNTLVVTKPHLQMALKLLMDSEQHMPLVMSLITTSEQGTMIQFIHSIIGRHQRIMRGDLLKLISHKISARELDLVIDTLAQSGYVTIEHSAGKIYYKST